MDDDIPYLLLTPGPLSTSRSVRQAMLRDLSTWDVDYNSQVDAIRRQLVQLATSRPGYTCVPIQGSGTYGVEAAIGSLVPQGGKILIVNNGAYGKRMVQIADRLRIARVELAVPETEPADLGRIESALKSDPAITHLAMVHCETTTGLLNPVADAGRVARQHGTTYLVDAMSSFGGIPLSMEELGAHYLVSSANKCIQGVPGFAFVIAETDMLQKTRGWARSLSLDLFDQWREMEENAGKWRYTSPTHVVCAFAQALKELEAEGGVSGRHRRYVANCQTLLAGMEPLGFRPLLPASYRSPIITSFHVPVDARFSFPVFYDALKKRRFVIYPGKVSSANTFRIGTIGHAFPEDFALLTRNIGEVLGSLGWKVS